MELKFTKEHGGWVSEFEATADFNLHVEGVYEGNVSIYQRGTAGGGYAFVKDSRPAPSAGTVYDYDFTSLVYPKFIKVVCTDEPAYAEVVTTGEVTELKHQSKAVEITANGTTSITPDAGFAALNAVEVKVNVPTSGGSASGENTYEYIDVRGMGEMKALLAMFALAVRFDGAERYTMPIAQFMVDAGGSAFSKVLAVMIDTSFVIDMGSDGQFTCYEVFAAQGVDIDSLPRLTKEEFYTL